MDLQEFDRQERLKRPSTYKDGPYIFARANYPEGHPKKGPTAKTGKWMIFRRTGAPIDIAWRIVREATWENKLGFGCKVTSNNGRSSHVICVYTYDYTDEDDVFRVRQALRELGFTEKLGYKTNKASRRGSHFTKWNE